jgi:type IV secretory pathway VirD2 relaxase
MSNSGFARIHGILEGNVKFKRSKVPPPFDKARARRVVRRSPEVMVKITGFGTHTRKSSSSLKGLTNVKAHLDYIGRNAKLELENERGEIISGKEAVRELNQEWSQDRGKRRANTRDTTHIVLSMPPKTDEKKLKKAVRGFAREQFGDNHQYVWVMHSDSKNPHAHLAVKNLGHDGTRLHIAKGDPQKWRELFAEKLRLYGIEAEATARAPRGVVKKSVTQPVYHLRKRGKVPKTDRAKVEGAIREITSGKEDPRPWEKIISSRQTEIRKAWLQSAKELSASSDSSDREFAADIVRYVKSMPAVATERQGIQVRLDNQTLKGKSLRKDAPEQER